MTSTPSPTSAPRRATDHVPTTDRALLALLLTLGAAHLLWTMSGWRPQAALPYLADLPFTACFWLASALCWRAGARCQQGAARREARAWQLFSAGLLAWGAGELYYFFQDVRGQTPPFPGWSDAGFLLLPPLVGAAILHLPRARLRRFQAAGFALDISIVTVALGAVFWRAFMAANITEYQGNLAALLVAQAYPVSDVLLVAMLLTVLLWKPAGASGVALLPIGAGLLLLFAGDVFYAAHMATDNYINGTPFDALWPLSAVAFGFGASLAHRPLGALHRRVLAWLDRGQQALSILPYAAVASIFTLLAVSTQYRGAQSLGVLIAAIAITVLVLGRQFLSLRETNRLSRRLSYDASHDALTGLLSRSALISAVDAAGARAQSEQLTSALLFIDLDGFKRVNDTLGHAAGDELLRAVATRIGLVLRPQDTAARLGGDEFVLLLEHLAEAAVASVVAARVVSALSQPFVLAGQDVQVSASVGVTLMPVDAVDAASALRNSDLAMYRAKQNGKNSYFLFDKLIAADQQQRLRLEDALRGAADRGELRLVWQPQFTARERTLDGFEALLRWHHPEFGEVAPGVFIPIAEETGMIHGLGGWVLAELARQARAWGSSLGETSLSVNISPIEFSHPELVPRLRAAVTRSGLRSGQLRVEVTESAVVGDLELAQAKLRELRAMGVRISLDDFGTGFSSLSQLRALSTDELKLDRSFVLELHRGAGGESMLRAIVDLAHSLGLLVVAEGIETEQQLLSVVACGADRLQGYHLGRPLEAEQAGALLCGAPVCAAALP